MPTIFEQLQQVIDSITIYTANQPASPEVTAKYLDDLNGMFTAIFKQIQKESDITSELRGLLAESKQLLAESKDNALRLTFSSVNYRISELAAKQEAKKLNEQLETKYAEIDDLINQAVKHEEARKDWAILNHLREEKIAALNLELQKKEAEIQTLKMQLEQRNLTPSFDFLARTTSTHSLRDLLEEVSTPPQTPKQHEKKLRQSE